MWWDPSFDPLPSYGVTTAVFGNCGMSMAPLDGPQRDEVVDLFCFLEDLPLVAFEQEVPWTWANWAEYRAALDAQPTAANIAGYVGHISLRTFVMGDAAWERPASAAERTAMAKALDEALAAGALGLSTNGFDMDRTLRLVPSRHADDAEYAALFDVLAAHPGTTFQSITRFNEPEHNLHDVQRFADLASPRASEVSGRPFPPLPMRPTTAPTPWPSTVAFGRPAWTSGPLWAPDRSTSTSILRKR